MKLLLRQKTLNYQTIFVKNEHRFIHSFIQQLLMIVTCLFQNAIRSYKDKVGPPDLPAELESLDQQDQQDNVVKVAQEEKLVLLVHLETEVNLVLQDLPDNPDQQDLKDQEASEAHREAVVNQAREAKVDLQAHQVR